MNEPTPPITGQAAKLTTTKVDDTTTLVCVIHLNASPVFAECCAVARDGASRRIGKSPTGWRFDSASAEAYADGTVRLWLSCWPDGQSGTEAAVRWIDFPDALPPQASSVAGGAYVEAPGSFIRAFTQANFDGSIELDLARFGIPVGCQWVNVKLTVSSPSLGRRVHVSGTDAPNEFGCLSCASQAPNIRNYNSGPVAPSPDHTLILKTQTGPVGEVHLDIQGWQL